MVRRAGTVLSSIIALAGLLAAAPVAGGEWRPPQALVGTWSGVQRITVRLIDERGNYQFVAESVEIDLVVGADGRVGGAVGGALLTNGRVAEHRGWLGRLLGLGTDYQVTGRLVGAIFEMDALPAKEVSAPLDLKGATLRGDLFQHQARDLFRMAGLELSRTSAAP